MDARLGWWLFLRNDAIKRVQWGSSNGKKPTYQNPIRGHRLSASHKATHYYKPNSHRTFQRCTEKFMHGRMFKMQLD